MKADISRLNAKLVFFVGVNTGFVNEGEPDERYIDFYRSRSSKDLYCAIVGNVVIPGGFGSNSSTAVLSRSKIWSQLAAEISVRGTLPGIQLATAWAGYQGSRNFRPNDGDQTIARARELVSSVTRPQLDALLVSFDLAAEFACLHGFKHIQVHAAHGYLLSLLLDRRISEAPHHYIQAGLSNLVQRWRREGLETSIRISLRTGDAAFDATGREDFYAAVLKLPFDFVDVSSGFYNINKQLIYPARPDIIVQRRADTIALASNFPGRNFILSGRALAVSKSDLPGNVHIGICRDLIANPRFLSEPLNGCMNSGKCHYFSRGETHITCGKWPQTRGEPLLRHKDR